MSMDRKARGDAKLKTLPEERQADIYGRAQGMTLAKLRAELLQDGLDVGLNALSQFLSWYGMRLAFRQNEADTASFLEELKEAAAAGQVSISAEKVSELGESLFNLLAIRQQDPKLFLAMQTAKHKARMDHLKFAQKEKEIALNERRIKILEAKAAQADAAKAVVESELSPEEKQLKMKAIFGMS